MSSKFFGMKSIAPASSALKVELAPSNVNDENIKIGVGHFAMISLTAVMPSITGISTSMVITSGRSFSVIATPSLPSFASPTTCIEGSDSKISFNLLRKKDESSTIKILVAITQSLIIIIFLFLGLLKTKLPLIQPV